MQKLTFRVIDEGVLGEGFSTAGAYLVGSDNNPLRGDIAYEGQSITCTKREAGVAALALQQPVCPCGELVIRTCLLPERDEPYLLMLELARSRLLLLYSKLEDWAMFDAAAQGPIAEAFTRARGLFVQALCHQQQAPDQAERLARESLVAAIDTSEQLSLLHADTLLSRRKASGAMPKYPVGCGVMLDPTNERMRAGLLSNFDFFYLPTPWCALAPDEEGYQWRPMDSWAKWLTQHRVPVLAGPVVCFEPGHVPDWLFIWENDYETIRDLVYEHAERVVTRYRNTVAAWNVISGIHVNNHFNFNFDQIMELSRMTTMLVKNIQPAARALVGITQPFGEYYATNQRSVPPVMYANLLLQSSIRFDGFVIKLLMGQPTRGQHTRDLMQISHLLDQFVGFGKPITLVVAAPSQVPPCPGAQPQAIADHADDPDEPDPVATRCGHWRQPWSPQIQSRWLDAVFKIAMSKPFIDAVGWYQCMDQTGLEADLPMAGLVNQDLQPKPAFRKLAAFRQEISNGAPGHHPRST